MPAIKSLLVVIGLSCLGLYSTGCDTSDKTAPPDAASCAKKKIGPGGDWTCEIRSGTSTRVYILYASKNYDPTKPTALIVDAHGAMEGAEVHAGRVAEFCPEMQLTSEKLCWTGKGSGWTLEADMPGNDFIVAVPHGTNELWSQNDEQFILDMVKEIKGIANIDQRKVYITGISNGGLLSYWVGCPNAKVFSGMAPIAGGANCTSVAKPIPVIAFDSKPDFAYSTSISARDAIIKLNGCKSGPATWLTVDSKVTDPICRDDAFSSTPKLVPCSSITPAIKPSVCQRWYDCNGGVEVVFCEVAPADEHGPGNEAFDAHILYSNASNLNLPSLTWRFFKRFQ